MVESTQLDQRFGDIAVERRFLTKERLDRALLVQRCIFNRTNMHMPIGKVLKEMGLLNQEQIDAVLELQRTGASAADDAPTEISLAALMSGNPLSGINVIVAKDKLSATIEPSGEPPKNVTVESVKALLGQHQIINGIIGDKALASFLSKDPLPREPLTVALGTAPEAGNPSKVVYRFDTNPLRIGTVNADGTIDWKNRGTIPQVKSGTVLAEKVGGDPGKPGTTIFGTEIPPPRVREPQLKCGRGVQRSEDGKQAVAKMDGSPRLTSDGRITVFSLLPIEGDVGLDTGHVDFDGYIEVEGAVNPGFNVKGRGLRTKEIQKSNIELSEDLVSQGGIYGSTLTVGGDMKASHLHNCVIEVVGDIVVEKEIFNCTIETNGRCVIPDGTIIASKIDAKKGIIVKDVGTTASNAAELTVGIDRRHEREMKACKETLTALEQQEKELKNTMEAARKMIDEVAENLGDVAQDQDRCMVQKRQLEEKSRGFEVADNEEERRILNDLIEGLTAKIVSIDAQVAALMQKDDQLRLLVAEKEKAIKEGQIKIQEIKEQIVVLDEALKVDPGIPVVKVSGTVYAKTLITGPLKKISLQETMHCVRIAESQMEGGGNRWQMKISNLR